MPMVVVQGEQPELYTEQLEPASAGGNGMVVIAPRNTTDPSATAVLVLAQPCC